MSLAFGNTCPQALQMCCQLVFVSGTQVSHFFGSHHGICFHFSMFCRFKWSIPFFGIFVICHPVSITKAIFDVILKKSFYSWIWFFVLISCLQSCPFFSFFHLCFLQVRSWVISFVFQNLLKCFSLRLCFQVLCFPISHIHTFAPHKRNFLMFLSRLAFLRYFFLYFRFGNNVFLRVLSSYY